MRLPIQLPGMMEKSPFQKPPQLPPFNSHLLYKQTPPPGQACSPNSQQNQQHPVSIQVRNIPRKYL